MDVFIFFCIFEAYKRKWEKDSSGIILEICAFILGFSRTQSSIFPLTNILVRMLVMLQGSLQEQNGQMCGSICPWIRISN